MNCPLVSIIIPVFNDEKYIEETLESVKNQEYTNWQCIIVNDGSTDNSETIIKNYITNNIQFIYLSKENSGVSDTRNFGIEKCSGEYILPLDSDDLISTTYLKEAITVFNKNPETALVYCNANFFGEKNSKFKLQKYVYEDLVLSNSIFCSAIYRKSDFMNTNGYDINLKLGLEDWEFWITFLNAESKVVKLDKVHFFYRIKTNSRNRIHDDAEKINAIHEYIFQKHKTLYENILFQNQSKIKASHQLMKDINELKKVKKSLGYKIYKIEREIKKIFTK